MAVRVVAPCRASGVAPAAGAGASGTGRSGVKTACTRSQVFAGAARSGRFTWARWALSLAHHAKRPELDPASGPGRTTKGASARAV